MTYGNQITTRTRYPFTSTPAKRPRMARKKLARLRKIKRLLHFVGFLAYWSVVLSVTYLAALAVMIVCICLS